jgi:4-amino-4-deoxy-L-arabinose transferase-like glycosyltransferase
VQSFWIDEGFSTVYARAILEYGYPQLPNGVVSWRGFPAHYLMAAGIAIFNDLQLGARVFAALAGTLLIPAVYILGKRVTGSHLAALVAAALLAFLAYEIAWSRQARMYACLDLFVALALIYFYGFMERHRPHQLVLAALFTFLAIATHRAGYLALLVICLAGLLALPRPTLIAQWVARHRAAAVWISLAWVALLVSLLLWRTHSSLAAVLHGLSEHNAGGYFATYASFLWGQLGWVLGWAVVGAAYSIARQPRKCLPLLLAAALYLFIISEHTALFHFRYLLPALWLILLFAGIGVAGSLAMLEHFNKRAATGGRPLVAALFCASLVSGQFIATPHQRYWLGWTAPQPEWRVAYSWLGRHHAEQNTGTSLVTVSVFPMFHDFYLDGDARKYFLPFRYSRRVGHEQKVSNYSTAEPVDSLETLRSSGGYVVLDNYGLEMLANRDIRAYLNERDPLHVVESRGGYSYRILIWKIR